MANKHLIELLREQAKEAEQELQSLQVSLRYKIGDVVLQALPLSWSSLRVLPRLLKLYRSQHLRSTGQSRALSSPKLLPEDALLVTDLGLGSGFQDNARLWTTTDPELMSLRLQADASITSLVLRCLSVSVVRQLARIQQTGAKIIWFPDPALVHRPELENYVIALADECRNGDTA